MLKVSFKDNYKKVQTFNDRATLVTLIGEMKMPTAIWQVFPNEVANWMWDHQGVDVSWGKNTTKDQEVFRVEVIGKAVCAEGDTFNPVTGQRIAESRAKIKLYKFMLTLCKNLMQYYFGIMYGNAETIGIKESHTEKPKDCLRITTLRYMHLWNMEVIHLNKLIEKA